MGLLQYRHATVILLELELVEAWVKWLVKCAHHHCYFRKVFFAKWGLSYRQWTFALFIFQFLAKEQLWRCLFSDINRLVVPLCMTRELTLVFFSFPWFSISLRLVIAYRLHPHEGHPALLQMADDSTDGATCFPLINSNRWSDSGASSKMYYFSLRK